jgi:hypothetical protein
MKQGNYQFVPAGLFGPNHLGLAILVKYKKNPNKVVLRSQDVNHSMFSCPDRDIVLLNNLHTDAPIIDFDYDEMINVSPMWSVGNKPVNQFMTNYTQFIGKDNKSPNQRMNGNSEHFKGQTIYGDSGGYQIFSKRLDYVNPELLSEWNNRNVDYAMSLDIPTGNLFFSDNINIYISI